MKILGTNHVVKTRRKVFEIRSNKKYMKCRQDYANKSVAEFSTEIKSHNFYDNLSLSVYGVSLKYYRRNDSRNILTKNIVDTLTG